MFAFRQLEAGQRQDSYPLFDWLRFVLASVVALTHEGIIAWKDAGNFSVQVFFALSGWLIGGILVRSPQHDLPRFYFNRATRIWIPYFIAAIVLYALAAYRDGFGHNFIPCAIFDGTFTHNWFVNMTQDMPLKGTGNHFWSISVEEQFYLAAPLLIVLLPFGRARLFWIGVATLAVLSRSWYGAISLGVLAAVARPQFGDWQLAAIGGLSVAGMLTLDYWIFAPLVAICVILLASKQGPRSKIGEFLGGVSYPLYLYHWIGMFAANVIARHVHLLSTGWTAYTVGVVAGTIGYLVVDRNIMRWRPRLYRPEAGKWLMVTAYSLLGAGVAAGLATL